MGSLDNTPTETERLSGGIKRLDELRVIDGMTDTLIENIKQEGITAE